MHKHSHIDFADVNFLNRKVFFIKPYSRVVLELEMVKKMVNECNQMLDADGQPYGYILDMSNVAFVTEDARDFITEATSHRGEIVALALVSNNHLGNIISTLMISFSNQNDIPIQLFKSFNEAEDWTNQLLEQSKAHLLKTA